ncbi:Pkinase-domain-containing protein [Ceraceosorus guamensis]|uniref:non-specific serine/threonine protein kinase n=1 Tax=Ceraceosorus guamensis TaxID=1522189 RepID=A0A316W9I0_9BASI|nr:Pkinase-domain-containing protein [Ceraceosorus guamensis]PWN46204.1 Pkinase-domain-containing protein [Ceraceosorus guamensis]
MAEPTSSRGQTYPVIEGYRLAQVIGGGGFSRVFKALNASATKHRLAAVKLVHYVAPSSQSTRKQHPPDRRALQKEVQVHALLRHENVLEFIAAKEIGVGKDSATLARERNWVAGLYMVLEFAEGGDLFDKIPPDQGVEEDLAHFYFMQLIAALEYCHGQGIAHRDVKPENLLLDSQGNLKLADFGLCAVYKYQGKTRELNGPCGSLPYIAPEMNGLPYKGEPVDVWSAGAVLFAMLVGNTPWDEPTKRSPEYVAYLSGELFDYDPWPRLSPDSFSLLQKMMCPDPRKRISLAEIKRHRWYQSRPNQWIENGKCKDALGLAAELLHGLALTGDLDVAELHSDGMRASVPDTVSFSQPDPQRRPTFFERKSEGAAEEEARPSWHALRAPSTCVAQYAREDPDKKMYAMSQQIETRREGLSSTFDPRAGGSQFTQAMNHLTSWSSLAAGASRFSPQLTRFFSKATAAQITLLLAKRLDHEKISFQVEPVGIVLDEEGAEGLQESTLAHRAPPVAAAAALLAESREGAAGIRRSDSGAMKLDRGSVGSRGCKISLWTHDRRKCALRGEIRVEAILRKTDGEENEEMDMDEDAMDDGIAKAMIIMRRSKGSPLEWRRLFRALAGDEEVRKVVVSP